MAGLICFCLVLVLSIAAGIDGYYNEQVTLCRWSSRDLHDLELIDSHIFNKVEYIRFNSTVNKFVGYTEFGVYNAERWNNDTAYLAAERAELDRYCRYNAGLYYANVLDKTVKPEVQLQSVAPSSGRHPAMLMCSAYNFYPKLIKVTWHRDGKEVTSDVTSTEELADGDWYYQIHSHLEYTPKSGEKISCVVEHASLHEKPMVIVWEPTWMPLSDIALIAIGASGLMLGVIVAAAGLVYYFSKRKPKGSCYDGDDFRSSVFRTLQWAVITRGKAADGQLLRAVKGF